MTPAGWRRKVTVMATADHDGPGPDLYQLLGVPREASRDEVAQAWRRRARDEHPDRRPGEAADEATGRFRVLAEAWRVLGDPARRAAYDRALAREQPPVTRVPAQRPSRPGWRDGTTTPVQAAGPPLRAGPVRIEGGPGRQAGSGDEEDVRLALLAELLLRYLARDGGRPW
jgi:curved DNA-binding protein CbpA